MSSEWGGRIPADRIGAVRHSAGGYSVLTLGGAQGEPAHAARHCQSVRDDPGFCALARGQAGSPAAVSVPDLRIRAVVALAPMAVAFTPESLAAITVPVPVYVGVKDALLDGAYHGGLVVANLRNAPANTAAGAGHFAFMAPSIVPLPSIAGDATANPEGFDRPAFLAELENQVAGFFAEQWRRSPAGRRVRPLQRHVNDAGTRRARNQRNRHNVAIEAPSPSTSGRGEPGRHTVLSLAGSG